MIEIRNYTTYLLSLNFSQNGSKKDLKSMKIDNSNDYSLQNLKITERTTLVNLQSYINRPNLHIFLVLFRLFNQFYQIFPTCSTKEKSQ